MSCDQRLVKLLASLPGKEMQKPATALLLTLISGVWLHGDVITYTWQGTGDAAGSFSIDSSFFNDTSVDFVSEADLSSFSFDCRWSFV